MTEQEKDVILGKAVREHAEVSREIAALRARLRDIAEVYENVALALRANPELLVGMGESVDMRFQGIVQFPSWEPLHRALELSRELRAAIVREEALSRQLSRLGVPPR